MAQDDKINLTLSGGDPLLHPQLKEILQLSEFAHIDILTSGLAFTAKNPRRKELARLIAQYRPKIKSAQPGEDFHSITEEDVKEASRFLQDNGYKPKIFGYQKESQIEKILMVANPMSWIPLSIAHLTKKYSHPQAIPIGRAKILPEENLRSGVEQCIEKNPWIYINYDGKIQYCLYSCHDGFMNIKELRAKRTKAEAAEYILKKLQQSITYKDMQDTGRCYFSRKIRKNK